MDFISNKPPQIEEMLKAIGLQTIEDLFEAIPAAIESTSALIRDDGLVGI